MSLADPYEPLDPAEIEPPKKKAPEKVPIVPVPDDAPECTFKHPAFGPPVRMWAYRDRDGQLLGYDARFEFMQDGKLRKDVLPITYCEIGDKRGWRSKAMPAPRALYGLHELAQRPLAPVVVAEGAKSADAAGTLLPDHVAVSWSGGSKALGKSDWHSLADRDVLIWPDRDRQCAVDGEELSYDAQQGTIAAENVFGLIKGFAKSVRILHLEDYDCKPGWDADDAVQDGWSADDVAAFLADYAKDMDLAAPGTILPYGYQYYSGGLYYESGNESLRLAGPVKVLAKTRDTNSESWGLLLEWRDYDGRLHRYSMPAAVLAGDGSALREELLNRGLYISSAAKARQKLMEFFGTVDTPLRARAVTKVGWAGDAFALPQITIGDTPAERVIFQHPDAGSHHYSTAGTLAEWQEHVGKLAIGNSRLVLAVAAAFVGPLLAPACKDGSGINVVGSSSTGKTTALRAAASVWGAPRFIRQWRATSNGLEGIAVQHNETLLCLDELSQIDPREAGPTAYMLSNGQGKGRSLRNGRSRPTSTWNIMYLSTGETGLAGIMAEVRSGPAPKAGQEVRILDVPADAGRGMGLFENTHGAASPSAFSRQIKTAASIYYGTPAIEFLTKLTAIRAKIGDMVEQTVREFVAANVPAGSDGQVERAAECFGLIATAGELATSLGILPWPQKEATGACAVMFASWLKRRGGNESAEERNIIAQARAFFETHGASRFSSVEDADEHQRTVLNRAGFWRLNFDKNGDGVREYLVLPEAFKTEICRGFEVSTVIAALKRKGALKPGPDGRNTVNQRLPTFGVKRAFRIGPELFDGGE